MNVSYYLVLEKKKKSVLDGKSQEIITETSLNFNISPDWQI